MKIMYDFSFQYYVIYEDNYVNRTLKILFYILYDFTYELCLFKNLATLVLGSVRPDV